MFANHSSFEAEHIENQANIPQESNIESENESSSFITHLSLAGVLASLERGEEEEASLVRPAATLDLQHWAASANRVVANTLATAVIDYGASVLQLPTRLLMDVGYLVDGATGYDGVLKLGQWFTDGVQYGQVWASGFIAPETAATLELMNAGPDLGVITGAGVFIGELIEGNVSWQDAAWGLLGQRSHAAYLGGDLASSIFSGAMHVSLMVATGKALWGLAPAMTQTTLNLSGLGNVMTQGALALAPKLISIPVLSTAQTATLAGAGIMYMAGVGNGLIDPRLKELKRQQNKLEKERKILTKELEDLQAERSPFRKSLDEWVAQVRNKYKKENKNKSIPDSMYLKIEMANAPQRIKDIIGYINDCNRSIGEIINEIQRVNRDLEKIDIEIWAIKSNQ